MRQPPKPEADGESSRAADGARFSIRRPWGLVTQREHRTRLFAVGALFVPLVMIGTLLHEGGHIAVAQALGHKTRLFYGWADWDSLPEDLNLAVEGLKWKKAHPDEPFPQQKALERMQKRESSHRLWIRAGGPVQSMSFGTLGLLWLLLLGPRGRTGRRGWAATLLALFWSRQPFNFLFACGLWTFNGESPTTDEALIAVGLGWSPWGLLAFTGMVGLGVCVAVIALQPPERRWHVLVAGPVGCAIGLAVWYGALGPLLLPTPW
jgi:hypothetical protein